MTPSSLLMKLRRNWLLVLAIVALIIAIAFLLIPQPIQDYPPHGFGQTVNYWELVNRPAQSYADFGVCIGFWVLVPFAALYIWLRRKQPLVPIAVFVIMLVASLMMCSSAARSIPSTILTWEDRGTVQFDSHIYHLALFEYSRAFDMSSTEFELYECNLADTSCQQYWTVADSTSFTGKSSNASLVVEPSLNQLQVIANGEIALRLDAVSTALPGDLFTSVPITLDNVEKIADEFDLNGRGGDELAWSPTGDRLASLNTDRYLWVYSFNGGQAGVHSLFTEWYLDSISFNRTGSLLASANNYDGSLSMWDITTEQVIQTMPITQVDDLAFSPQNDVLALGRYDDIVLYDTVTNKEIAVLKDQRLQSLAFSPDGSILAVTTYDDANERSVIRLWDVNTKTVDTEITLERYSSFSSRVVFSPDGNTIAYAVDNGAVNSASGGQIHIWDIANQVEKLHIDFEPYQWINSLAFNHDGTLLVSGNSEGVMEVWNPDTGELILSRKVSQSGISSIAFNPDGNVLAISSSDGAVHLWSIKP